MVNLPHQQAEAFGAVAAATQQQKYDVMFTAVPKYDGKNKEGCSMRINRVLLLATSAEQIKRRCDENDSWYG